MNTRAWLFGVLLVARVATAVGEGPQAGEQVIAVCVVPSREQAVGEVRLLRRGDVGVVQTLLETTLMRRVVAEIRVKEERNWPAGEEGSEDAQRYLASLEQVQRGLWRQAAASGGGPLPPQRLAIEFRLGVTQASVVLAEFQAEGEIGHRRAVQIVPRDELALHRPYVQRNMRLILEDACRPSEEQLRQWLRKLPGHGKIE